MSFFGDMLEHADDLGDYDVEDLWKFDKPKQLSFKMKSSSGDVNLSQSTDMVAGKNAGEYDFKAKAEMKWKVNEHKLKFVASNKQFELEDNFKPADFNKDGVETSVEVSAKCTPAKADWEGKVELKTGGQDFGGVVSHAELQFDTNKAKEHTVTYSHNFTYDKNHMVGSKMVFDANSQKLSEAYGVLATNGHELGNFWFRSNCLNRIVGLGIQSTQYGCNYSKEFLYDFKNKENVGMFDMPLFCRGGLTRKLSNDQKFTARWLIGKEWWFFMKWEVPVNKNTKVTYSDHADWRKLVTDPKSFKYLFGFAVEYKL